MGLLFVYLERDLIDSVIVAAGAGVGALRSTAHSTKVARIPGRQLRTLVSMRPAHIRTGPTAADAATASVGTPCTAPPTFGSVK